MNALLDSLTEQEIRVIERMKKIDMAGLISGCVDKKNSIIPTEGVIEYNKEIIKKF